MPSFECMIEPKNKKYSKMIINKDYGTLSTAKSYHEAMEADCAIFDEKFRIIHSIDQYKEVKSLDATRIVRIRQLDSKQLEFYDLYISM